MVNLMIINYFNVHRDIPSLNSLIKHFQFDNQSCRGSYELIKYRLHRWIFNVEGNISKFIILP